MINADLGLWPPMPSRVPGSAQRPGLLGRDGEPMSAATTSPTGTAEGAGKRTTGPQAEGAESAFIDGEFVESHGSDVDGRPGRRGRKGSSVAPTCPVCSNRLKEVQHAE